MSKNFSYYEKLFSIVIKYDKTVLHNRYFSSTVWKTLVRNIIDNNFNVDILRDSNRAEITEFLDFIDGNGFRVTVLEEVYDGLLRVNIKKDD